MSVPSSVDVQWESSLDEDARTLRPKNTMSKQPFAVNDIVEDVDTGKRWVVCETYASATFMQSLRQNGTLGTVKLIHIPTEDGYRKVGVWSESGVEFTR